MIRSLFDEAAENTQNEEKNRQTETPVVHSAAHNENNSSENHQFNKAQENNPVETNPSKNIDDKHEMALPDENNIFFDNNEIPPNVTFTLSDSFTPSSETEKSKIEIEKPLLFQMQNKPESTAETARKSGLAMSAAIALFGSVVFLLVIGWFADLLLGTSPWGIVGGIVLGSIVGFLQFFRMTSQILKNNND